MDINKLRQNPCIQKLQQLADASYFQDLTFKGYSAVMSAPQRTVLIVYGDKQSDAVVRITLEELRDLNLLINNGD